MLAQRYYELTAARAVLARTISSGSAVMVLGKACGRRRWSA